MSPKPRKIRHIHALKFAGGKEIHGLSSLINQLEKDFFSNITVNYSTETCAENNLVIHMDCPLGLHEVLYHMQQGNWGISSDRHIRQGISTLRNCMQNIRELNGTFIDVEELSIQLCDCTIIIKKVAAESIEYELGTILNALAENYVFITRRLSMTPMEIFIPVYEEAPSEEEIMRLIGPEKIEEKGYYSYWGLYFESDEEAVIYDIQQKKIISGDLNLLNNQ